MKKYFIMEDTLSAIATAIRSKSTKTDLIKVENYVDEIMALTGGIQYVEPTPLTYILYADKWDGTSYELEVSGYETAYNCLIDLPAESGVANTQAVLSSGLTAPRAYKLSGVQYITISAVTVPTMDVAIAIYGLTKVQDSTYKVSSVENASYGFSLNSSGYYESGNKGIKNSYAICKVELDMNGEDTVVINCINYAEANFDFGILSNVDTTLNLDSNIDSSNVFKSFQGASSSNIVAVDYGRLAKGSHYIYIKFRKDGSNNYNNDSLQFSVSFQKVEEAAL